MNYRLKSPALLAVSALTYQAIKDGRIQVVTIPQGSSVVVQPKAAK